MRPSAFTDGNLSASARRSIRSVLVWLASMRPSAFTDGNFQSPVRDQLGVASPRFNEAVGFHRRKPASRSDRCRRHADQASMRPSAFTDGNRVPQVA